MEKILVATDGSDHAKTAVILASDLASKYRARLIVLHIVLANIKSETLQELISRSELSEEQRVLLDSYEDDFLMAMGETGGGFVAIPPPQELVDALGQQITGQAEKVAHEAGVEDVSTMLVTGDAADAILDCAEYEGVNMIVLGSRGLSDFKGLFLGSVSHKVSSQAECTCVTVK